MGEQLLAKPLEILNETEVFDNGLTIGEIHQRADISKNPMAKDRIDFYKRLFGMYDDNLIIPIDLHDKARIEEFRRTENLYTNVDSVRVRISAKGVNLLNDIRMKKIMEDLTVSSNALHDSIKKFNDSSANASFWLIVFTIAIAIFAFIQVAITIHWI